MDRDILLQKFLYGELSKDEAEQFHTYLETDDLFAKKVKLESLFYAHNSIKIKEHLTDHAKTHVGVDNEKIVKPVTTSSKLLFLKPLINVAAILVLGIVGYFVFQSVNKTEDLPSIEHFYSETFPSPGIMQSESGEEDYWNNAIIFYSEGQYILAQNEILKIDSLTAQQKFYLGLSYMKRTPAKLDSSITILKNIIDDPNNLQADATQWYLALAYLKANQQALALPMLESIAASKNHFKEKQAIQVLEYLRNH